MPRVSPRYAENSLDEYTTEDEPTSSFEIDLLNPRPEKKSRVRGREITTSRLASKTRTVTDCDAALTKLPTVLSCCTLTEGKNCRVEGEIGRFDVDSWQRESGDRGIPRIIRAIRHHSERSVSLKDRKETSSCGGVQIKNSKSSVVVLYDVKSNKKRVGDSSPGSYHSTSSPSTSPSFFLNPPPVRVSKSERTIVKVALPSVTEERRYATERSKEGGNNQTAISVEIPDIPIPREREEISCVRGRKSTRHRRRRRSRSNKRNVKGKRVAGSWEREQGRNLEKRCRTPERFSRCLMAHRFPCPGQVVRPPGKCEVNRELGITNSGIASLMRHMQNQQLQRETRERVETKGEAIEDTTTSEKRTFPFQETASGNLKIIPNQVVFESKKVSVLVADPKHTRINVKAEIGKGDVSAVAKGVSEATVAQSRSTASAEYVPRTRPFRSPLSIQSEGMEGNQAIEITTTTSAAAMMATAATTMTTTTAIQHRLQPTNEVPLSSLGFTGEQPIDWQNIILPEKTDLYRELARRITNYKNADCIVRLGQDEFHCHLLVLQCYSAYFDEKNCKEIDLTGSNVTSKAFGIIYDWMISPTIESCHLLRRDNILEIFMAAQQLGIKELEEQCWAFIDNDELFTEDTAFLLYLEARKIGNTAVMELMVPRIMKFFLMLVGTRDFLELSIDELCLLLRSNYICVNSEMEVLMSAVRWLMHDWQSRRQNMIQVLKCVRFGLIAPWQLVDVKRNPENPEFMELMSYPEVQKMVDDGLAFVIIKYWYGNQTEDYYHWIDLLGLTEPTNRNWAGEDKNYVTYQEFLLYLEEYQRTKMPELKSRKSLQARSSPRRKDGSALPGHSSRKPEGGFPECPAMASLGGSTGGGNQMLDSSLPAASNDPGKSERYNGRMPGSSSFVEQQPPPLPGAVGGTMSPEILGRYLSSFDRNAKGTASRISNERHTSNVGVDNVTLRRKSNITGDTNRCPWQPTNIIADALDGGNLHESNEGGDSCKSEEDAATTIQAVYRGYKARSKFHEIRKSSSEERQRTKKIAELLANGNRDGLNKTMEPVRVSVSLAGRSKRDERKSNIPRRSPSPRKKRVDPSCREDRLTVRDFVRSAKYKTIDIRQLDIDRSAPDEIHQHGHTGDSIQTIHRPGIFNNFDEKTPSVSQSGNTDTETDVFSPRANGANEIFPRNENLPLRISESIMSHGGMSVNYHGKDSLFFPNCESIVVFGGFDRHQEYGNGGNTAKDMYRFKSLENEWEYVGEIPEPRHHHSTVYLRGRIYLVGGADPRNENMERRELVLGSVWSFDPTTRVWFSEAELLTPRKDFGLVVSNGKMYAIGGQDRKGLALKSVEAYDPSEREWREMKPMNAARIGPAAVKYRDLIWVGGGMTTGSRKEPLTREVECYDPINDRWLSGEPLRSPRCFASMYVLDDLMYIIGGAARTSSVETGGITESIDGVDVWDRKSLVWRRHGEIGIARHGQATGSIGDQLLVIGGLTTIYMRSLRSVECYCCRTGKIIKGASSLPYPLSGHSSVSLPAANFLTTI